MTSESKFFYFFKLPSSNALSGGIDNPIDGSVKESELYDGKFGYEECDHVYDDPNRLVMTTSELAPYSTLSRSAEEQAQSAPALLSLPPRNKARYVFGDTQDSEPRYEDISQQQVKESSFGAVTDSPPHSPSLLSGYTSPNVYDECQPKPPNYDDCVPKQEEQTPPTLEDYQKLIHQCPESAANKSQSYASPTSLAPQEEEKVTEEAVALSSSVKPQAEQTDDDTGEKKDLAEQDVYFPLIKKSMAQTGIYQEVSVPASDATLGQPASREENDQVVAIKTCLPAVAKP